MSLSQAWARIRALFTFSQVKGVSDLQITDDATAAAPASLVAAAAPGAVAAADLGAADSAAAPAVLVVDSSLSAAATIAAMAAAMPALPGELVAAAAPGTTDAGALADVDPDDEAESGKELESLKAIAGGGVDLFVIVLKDLVSFGMALGHDFGAVYDESVSRAKALAAKL